MTSVLIHPTVTLDVSKGGPRFYLKGQDVTNETLAHASHSRSIVEEVASWPGFRLEVGLEDVEVSGTIDPGDPGCWTFGNGDPGYPGTPDEVASMRFTVGGVDWTDLLGGAWDELGEAALLKAYAD